MYFVFKLSPKRVFYGAIIVKGCANSINAEKMLRKSEKPNPYLYELYREAVSCNGNETLLIHAMVAITQAFSLGVRDAFRLRDNRSCRPPSANNLYAPTFNLDFSNIIASESRDNECCPYLVSIFLTV